MFNSGFVHGRFISSQMEYSRVVRSTISPLARETAQDP
jgi:hypothetical protein